LYRHLGRMGAQVIASRPRWPEGNKGRTRTMSQPQPSFANQSNLLGDPRFYTARIRNAADDLPSWTLAAPLVSAADGLVAALESMIQTRADTLWRNVNVRDPGLTQEEQWRRADALVSPTFAAANSAADRLQSAANDSRQALEAKNLPKAPSGVSEAMLLDRKADLSDIVQHFG